MINMSDPKMKKIISTIIVVVLVLAMSSDGIDAR